jgi:aspartyl protease family protein
LLWVAVIAAAGAGAWWMAKTRGMPLTGEDQGWVLQGIGALAIVSSGLLYLRRVDVGRTARYAALWSLVVGVLVIAYAYRNDLASIGRRVRAEVLPGYAVESSEREMALARGEGGHFFVMGKVNGAPVRFAVDTGATEVVLSPADAERAGIDVAALRFGQEVETANGIGRGALTRARSLEVGAVRLSDFSVTVNGAPMSSSLLGMSFLRRLESFEFRGERLILRWREPAGGGA